MQEALKAQALETIERYARWYCKQHQWDPDEWEHHRIDFEPVKHLLKYSVS